MMRNYRKNTENGKILTHSFEGVMSKLTKEEFFEFLVDLVLFAFDFQNLISIDRETAEMIVEMFLDETPELWFCVEEEKEEEKPNKEDNPIELLDQIAEEKTPKKPNKDGLVWDGEGWVRL